MMFVFFSMNRCWLVTKGFNIIKVGRCTCRVIAVIFILGSERVTSKSSWKSFFFFLLFTRETKKVHQAVFNQVSHSCSQWLTSTHSISHTQDFIIFSYLDNHPHMTLCRCWMDLKNPPFSCYSY